MKLAIHLVVFLAFLAAWLYTREDWLIGFVGGAAATLGIERTPAR